MNLYIKELVISYASWSLKIVFEVILYDLAASMYGNKSKSRVILQSYKILNTAYHFKMICSTPCREQNDNLR